MAQRHGQPGAGGAVDWSGEDISDESHSGVTFVDLDLSEAENRGASFEECTFRGARFNVSVHENSAFVNCTFAGCTFYGAKFTDCKFIGSTFDRCTFENVVVQGGNWSFVALPRADLHTASFRNVRLREADLTEVVCTGGVMRELDLSGALLRGADFSGCDLRGSDLSALDPLTVRLRGAIIDLGQTLLIAEALGLDVREE